MTWNPKALDIWIAQVSFNKMFRSEEVEATEPVGFQTFDLPKIVKMCAKQLKLVNSLFGTVHLRHGEN